MYAGRVKKNLHGSRQLFFRLLTSSAIAILAFALSGAMSFGQNANSTGAQSPNAEATSSSLALVPMPREVHAGALLLLNRGVGVSTASRDAEDRFAVADLVEGLKERGVHAREGQRGQVRIFLLRQDTKRAKDLLARSNVSFTPAMHDEGYALVTEGNRIYDIAATSAGLYYGAQTIKQLIVHNGPELGSKPALQGVTVRDWPAMKYRGMDDDLSRGPFPTLKFQEHQIKVFSEYKINIYSPYFENTLAYASNPLAAPPGGAMTASDVKTLVRYAEKYHITIIPEQEAFGHLHHTLMYDKYSQLAETPHGSVLAPGQPGSIELIKQWFTQIAQMFPGPFIHIGADETVDLGKGQTKALVEKEGLGKVYMDFLIQIYNALQPLHKKILFWGDIAMHDPAEVKTLPKDMIAVAWVYSPEPQGYDKWLQPFIDAGLETWVAPGVSNWSRVYPDNNEALLNIQRFIADGQRLGSTGELNTAWNDDGEGLFNQDWYGVLFGAAAGWQPGTSSIPQFQSSFGQVFHGDTTGKINQAQIELMAAQKILEDTGLPFSSDHLFWVDPWSPQGQMISAKLLPVVHSLRVHVENAMILMDEARTAGPLRETDALDTMEMGARRMDFMGYKFEAAQQIADEYYKAYNEQNDPTGKHDVTHELYTITSANGQCQDMRDGYGLTRDLYRQAWLKENRPYWLDNMTAYYDMSMQLWIRRGQRFSEVIGQWYETHKLPKPEELGLPRCRWGLPRLPSAGRSLPTD